MTGIMAELMPPTKVSFLLRRSLAFTEFHEMGLKNIVKTQLFTFFQYFRFSQPLLYVSKVMLRSFFHNINIRSICGNIINEIPLQRY